MVGKTQHDQQKHQNHPQKSVRNDYCTCPLEVNFSAQTPDPTGISQAFEFPTPPEFPIPSMVGIWIFSGNTHYYNEVKTRWLPI